MSQTQRLGKANTVVGHDGDDNYVQYYETKVVQWNKRNIILNTGGWSTVSTKTRMNQTSNHYNLGFYVSAKKGIWSVAYDSRIYLFKENCHISFNR